MGEHVDRHSSFPSRLSSARRARRFVRATVSGDLPGQALDTVELLTSEVVTNAVVHAASGPVVEVAAEGGTVRVSVADRCPGFPMPLQVHACAAKAGVDQVTRVLAMEWGSDGIRVNSIAPGPIEGTEGFQRLSTPAARQAMVKRLPLRRFGTLDDVAQLALFLASPRASYITGTVIPVDGGWSLWGGGGSSTAVTMEMGGAPAS